VVWSRIVSESVVPLYERLALYVCGPLGSSDPAVKSIPVPQRLEDVARHRLVGREDAVVEKSC